MEQNNREMIFEYSDLYKKGSNDQTEQTKGTAIYIRLNEIMW